MNEIDLAVRLLLTNLGVENNDENNRIILGMLTGDGGAQFDDETKNRWTKTAAEAARIAQEAVSEAQMAWAADEAARMIAAKREARMEALEDARLAASRAHRRLVGASDGDTYVSGTNADAAFAIQSLIDAEGKNVALSMILEYANG